MPYDHGNVETASSSRYTEATLAQGLKDGVGFILLGQPLSGKSHTLYNIIKRMDEFDVVKPLKNEQSFLDDAFSLLEGRKVVLLLDDLNDWVNTTTDLLDFRDKLSCHAASCVVAATCRDGSELGVVKSALGTGLHRFYEDIPLKLRLLPPTNEDKERLARGIHKDWDSATSAQFPTLGSITMAESMVAMSLRFGSLLPEQQDTLRGLQLLASAGVLPFTTQHLQPVLQHIFQRQNLHLADCLRALTEQAFLRPPITQDRINPEPAYLQQVVTYVEGKSPEDDFVPLLNVLVKLRDAKGLNDMGIVRLWEDDYELAEACFEQALAIEPENPLFWINKGAMLSQMGRYQDALASYNQALHFRPDQPIAWANKAAALSYMGQHEQAIDVLDEALRICPNDPILWTNKGTALNLLGRYQDALTAFEHTHGFQSAWSGKGDALGGLRQSQEALDAYEQALLFDPDNPALWANKGLELERLERYKDALDANDRAIELAPELPEAWNGKGMALADLDRSQEALHAYEQALRLRPDYPEAWVNKAALFGQLGAHQEALDACNEALRLQLDDSTVWRNKGVALLGLEDPKGALDAFDQSLRLQSADSKVLWGKACALRNLGRYTEALNVDQQGTDMDPDDPTLWWGKGTTLLLLERYKEALHAYEQALRLLPDYPEVWGGQGTGSNLFVRAGQGTRCLRSSPSIPP